MITGFRRIICRNIQYQLWRIEPLPRISDFPCWRILQPMILVTLQSSNCFNGQPIRFPRWRNWTGISGIFSIGTIRKHLRTLHPRYISSVDSGNLAGHLLTLRQGLLGLKAQKIVGPKLLNGLHDTARVAIAYDADNHAPDFFSSKKYLTGTWRRPSQFNDLKAYLENLAAQQDELLWKKLVLNNGSGA